MAIGGVISNRSFTSFLSPGNVCQKRNDVAHLKKEDFGSSIGLCGQGRLLNKTSHRLTKNCLTSKCSHCSLVCIINASDSSNTKHAKTTYDNNLFSHFHHAHDYFRAPSSIKRVRRLSRSPISSKSCCKSGTLVPSGPVDKFLVDNSKLPMSNFVGDSGVRAYYKSEEFDITEGAFDSLRPSEGAGEVVLPDKSAPKTAQLPKRWVVVLLCFAAFLLCNMDRVNMSIAILPMSKEFGWNSTTVGLIQSSFFWGYLLTQIAGGIWADKVGGKLVLGFGVIWWSIATVLTPIAAKISLPCLLIMRAFMGIGEGVAMPAMNNMISKWIPVSERSRALSLVYSGMYLGSVTGLAFSPILIHKFGWPSVFYSFGSLGSIWFALWLAKACHPSVYELSARETKVHLVRHVIF